MDNLPIEILAHILKYLNLADRREFALTCRRFYEASLDPELHWKSVYVFDAEAFLIEGDDYFYCKSPNLFITGLSENLNVKALLNPPNGYPSVLGSHVKRLSLKGSSILESSFVEILKKCESLEGLDLTGCNDSFMPGNFLCENERITEAKKVLEGLKDLNLSSIRYLDDKSLRALINISPVLESLILSSCNILFSEFGNTQHHSLTFHSLLEFVSLRSSTLIKIDLSRTRIYNSALRELAGTKNLRLEEIILQNCREIGDPGIVSLVKAQLGLRVLDLRGCLEIGNQSLSAICTCLTNLRELYVAKCRKMNDSSAMKILFLENLRILDISECYDIEKTIPLIMTSLPNLSQLSANGCNFTKFLKELDGEKLKQCNRKVVSCIETRIPTWLNSFTSLTTLSINSGKFVTDETIENIFSHLLNLENLSMSWCHHITDEGLLGLEMDISENKAIPSTDINTRNFLESGKYSFSHGRTGFLIIPGFEFKSSEDWENTDLKHALRTRGIGRLKFLKRLALSNCQNITDQSLTGVFCAADPLFPKMEHLELNMMRHAVTDDVINGISCGCPLLTKLAISCSKVTDEGVELLSRHLHRLEMLDLSNCDGISSRFFTVLSKNNRWLRELDVSSCRGIPASSVEKLQKSLPLLTKIHTRYSGVWK